MSVVIKDMETPKSCGKCKLFDRNHTIGLFAPLGWCHINDKEVFCLSEKADFCPADDVVEVVRCRECEYWERDRITCEGVARCRTGESGVRFRAGHDYCSRGIKRKDGGADRGTADSAG